LCRQVNSYEQAVCWSIAGDREKALDQLEKAVRERALLLMYAGVEPAFVQLRGQERFGAVLRAWKFGDLPAAR
jgi:hypothetical protein